MGLKSVYIYGSYRKIKTVVSLFWTTLYRLDYCKWIHRYVLIIRPAECYPYSIFYHQTTFSYRLQNRVPRGGTSYSLVLFLYRIATIHTYRRQ